MAHIEKLPSGKFRAHICRRGKRQSSAFELESDARRWAAKMEGRIDATDHLALSAIPKRILDAMNSIPYTAPEILEAAIPIDHMTGIYFLIRDLEVVYVGQSATDILGRIAKHRRDGREFDSFSYMRCDIEDIDAMEEKYILALMPRENYSVRRARET